MVAAAIAIAGAGCSLLVSTDGLSSSTPAADAGLPVEGGTDGSPRDAASDAEAGLPPPFCASLVPKPTLCADFDTGNLETLFRAAGEPALDTAVATSAPRSLLGIVEQGASRRYSSVNRDFNMTPASFDVSFQAYLDEYDATNDVELVTVFFRKPSSTCNIGVAVRRGKWTIDEYCEAGGNPGVNAIHRTDENGVRGKWTKVTFSASLVAPRVYSMSVDGRKTFDARPLDPGLEVAPVTVAAGVNYVQVGGGRAKLHMDDLTVDLR